MLPFFVEAISGSRSCSLFVDDGAAIMVASAFTHQDVVLLEMLILASMLLQPVWFALEKYHAIGTTCIKYTQPVSTRERKVPHEDTIHSFQKALPARLARAVEVGEVLESELSHGTLSMTSVCPDIHRLHDEALAKLSPEITTYHKLTIIQHDYPLYNK